MRAPNPSPVGWDFVCKTPSGRASTQSGSCTPSSSEAHLSWTYPDNKRDPVRATELSSSIQLKAADVLRREPMVTRATTVGTIPVRWSYRTAPPRGQNKPTIRTPNSVRSSESGGPISIFDFTLPPSRPREVHGVRASARAFATRSRVLTGANRFRQADRTLAFIGSVPCGQMNIGPHNSPIKTNQFADLNPNATKLIPPWAVDVPDGPNNQSASTSHGHQTSKDRTESRTRAPLISVYRGEAPVRSKSQTEINRASKPPHDGGLFQVYTSTKQRAPYYVIHPEWLSEPMSIKQLELFPRSSAGSATTKRASNPRSNDTNLSRRLNHTTSHGESKSAPVNRCRSMPCKPINPITWEP